MTEEPRAHWLTLTPTEGPAGGSQWLAVCRCGWVDVSVVHHLAESAGRAHLAAVAPTTDSSVQNTAGTDEQRTR